MSIEIDDVRLSDLSLGGWFGIGLAGFGIYLIGDAVIEWVTTGGGDPIALSLFGGLIAVVGAMLAYDNGRPECESHCDACGEYIRSQSSQDGVSEYVEVHASGTPRRARFGPLSLVTERAMDQWVYCSGECAAADAESRILVGHIKTEAVRAAEVDDAS